METASTRHNMKIGFDKIKIMLLNNPGDFKKEMQIRGHRLEEVKSFKYLGSVVCSDGPKPEILSRIAKSTAAFSRRKPT